MTDRGTPGQGQHRSMATGEAGLFADRKYSKRMWLPVKLQLFSGTAIACTGERRKIEIQVRHGSYLQLLRWKGNLKNTREIK